MLNIIKGAAVLSFMGVATGALVFTAVAINIEQKLNTPKGPKTVTHS